MQHVNVPNRLHVWFMHDGALPHFLLTFQELLSNTFPEQWIGLGGPTAWPARPYDLIPIHFYLWEYLKPTIFAAQVNGVQD